MFPIPCVNPSAADPLHRAVPARSFFSLPLVPAQAGSKTSEFYFRFLRAHPFSFGDPIEPGHVCGTEYANCTLQQQQNDGCGDCEPLQATLLALNISFFARQALLVQSIDMTSKLEQGSGLLLQFYEELLLLRSRRGETLLNRAPIFIETVLKSQYL